MIADLCRNVIDTVANYFEGVAKCISDPLHVDRERARNTLQAYWPDRDDVCSMITDLEIRELFENGSFNRNADALAEFLKCGATPWECTALLDECIWEWATTPVEWEGVVSRKCQRLVAA